MKMYLIILFSLMLGSACKSPSPKDKREKSGLILPPPVVKGENEVMADQKAVEPPAVEAIEIVKPEGNQIRTINPDVYLENTAATEKKIIKEGDIKFETNNVFETRRQIMNAIKKLDGYTDDDSETTNSDAGSKEYTLSIRVPAKNFDTFLGTVSSTATKIDSRNISVKDITSQFIDIKTRLDNKKLLEARYLQLLKKATKMSDLLQIEDKLTDIRSDIESTQSQLNYMSKQVAYSSLNITFYTKQAGQIAAGNGFGYKLNNALVGGWEFLQGLFFGVVYLWPLCLLIGVLWLPIKKLIRRKNTTEQATNPA